MKRFPTPPPSQILPIKKIQYLSPPRVPRRTIEDMTAVLQKHGQAHSIIVSQESENEKESKQPYTLREGSTELEAARALNWTTIKAVVLEPIVESLAENAEEVIADWVAILVRHMQYRMSDYDLAEAASDMLKKWEIKGGEFSQVMGLSKQYTYNLLRWYKHIPPDLRSAWKEQHPLLNQAELERFSHMSKEDVLTAWKMRLRMMSVNSGPYKPGRNGKKTLDRKPRRASEQQVAALQEAIDMSPLAPPAKELCSNIIKFIIGGEKNVPGITDYKKLHATLIVEKPEKVEKEI